MIPTYVQHFEKNATDNYTTYSASPDDWTSLRNELVIRMLNAEYTFRIAGSTREEVIANFEKHLAARERIVALTGAKKYNVAPEANGFNSTDPKVKAPHDTDDPLKFFNSINNSGTSLGCLSATQTTFSAGIREWILEKRRNLNIDVDPIFVPGDWGYIKNAIFDKSTWPAGLEGENVIYVDNDKLWGHIKTPQTVYTLHEWFEYIRKWRSTDGQQSAKPALRLWVAFSPNGLE